MIGLLTTEQAKFYIASMILAVEYLHFNNIVYRDIKPENSMVNENVRPILQINLLFIKGYFRLIDMGTAKFLKRKKKSGVNRTFTIIGSPQYMAPEIIEGHGYSFAVDIYSIGNPLPLHTPDHPRCLLLRVHLRLLALRRGP